VLPAAPLVLNWALTNRCTFACRHCYSRTERHAELPTDALRALVHKVAAARVLAVNFGGGEPLLHGDLCELARLATDLGLAVSLNTNGFLVDAVAARRLAAAGVRKVGVSIDSARPAVHDEFRGVPGSHARALAALGYLSAAGIETAVSAVVCRINAGELEALAGLARAAEAASINFHDFKCSGLGYVHRDGLDLAPAEWRAFYQQALALRAASRDLRVMVEDPVTAALGHRDGGALVKGSVCGKLSLCVKANGDLTPCGFIPQVIGNLVTDELATVWHTAPVLAAMRHKRPRGKCMSCGHYGDCVGGCSARALALTGALDSPDPHCWVSDEPG
jgi:GeoRSP system radical SAM/SPASM protein